MPKNSLVTPIVDTDIWVFLIMSGYEKRIIDYYGFIQFSDVVEKEIMRWKNNVGDYKKIATKFESLKASRKLNIISFYDFEKIEQFSINHQLSEYGLKEININEKNKGEYTSLLYALHKGIKRFKTNDRKFVEEIEDNIQNDITIVNWDDILENYSISLKEKSETKKIVANKEMKMKKQKEQYQLQNQDVRWDKLKALVG
ncbi:MAG TPA: hypothetical protein DCO67_06435 [Staphylococcus sp.]|nr:hypothetical protein [Staphylococcus sp.]